MSENENLRGRDPILSTQTFCAAEIGILSTQTFGGAILKKATDDMALFVATPILNFDRLAVGFAIGCRTGKNFSLRGLNGQEIL